ncbi:probable magnesium transporter NIPA8 isoform X2 [Solanum dulcamara]|uniref:probable magnesium transporter NIPA8 isoform X2 n=1 Tax=Solanum dulcamara TaxID=45834 RepID=UPI002486B737|nr:probable magnesium transporter NIPA8 isoform X2 [Solanum dulcamara]
MESWYSILCYRKLSQFHFIWICCSVTSSSFGIYTICLEYSFCLLCFEQNSDNQRACSHCLYCSWKHLPCSLWQPPVTWYVMEVYTPEQLAEKYSNITFLLYCLTLVLVVALHHSIYKRGELMLAVPMNESKPYWHMLLPFSYAVVSGAVGSCSVLFAKSLSNLLRLSMSSGYSLHSWFTYSMLLLFLSTAGFWMARLNEGLSFFDAILIVPMFQIAWTFFSICTGFVYFQEYQVFDALRTTMFILGMLSVFVGISLLAPDESKGGEAKDGSLVSTTSNLSQDEERLLMPSEDSQIKDIRSFGRVMLMKAANMIVKAKAACSASLGFGDDSLHASSVLVMPMVSSKITGFRGGGLDRRVKILAARGPGWNKFTVDKDSETILETTAMLPQIINLD